MKFTKSIVIHINWLIWCGFYPLFVKMRPRNFVSTGGVDPLQTVAFCNRGGSNHFRHGGLNMFKQYIPKGFTEALEVRSTFAGRSLPSLSQHMLICWKRKNNKSSFLVTTGGSCLNRGVLKWGSHCDP